MTKQREHTPTTKAKKADADPSAIAMRVERIADIVQVRGIFERVPAAQPESLTTEFLPIHASAQMLSDTDVGISLILGFIARAKAADAAPSEPVKSRKSPKTGAEGGTDADVRMYVEAGYVLRYVLTPGPKPTDAELQKFAEVNGRLNVTPYWREFLDTALRRAGLPPVLAPVYKVPAQGKSLPAQPDQRPKP